MNDDIDARFKKISELAAEYSHVIHLSMLAESANDVRFLNSKALEISAQVQELIDEIEAIALSAQVQDLIGEIGRLQDNKK